MNTLNYKGCVGSIEVSVEDGCLYGKVLALPDDTLITYEGETVAQLTQDFQGAVDDYIASCEANGIKPHKSYSGNLNVRISPETHGNIAMLASKAGISINAFIRKTLDHAVATML